VSSRPAFVVTIALSLILVMAVAGTVQYQKAVAQGGLIDKVQQFVKSVIEKCMHTVSTSGGTACNGPGGGAVQEGGGGAGAGCGGGGGSGSGGGSGPVFGGPAAQGSDGSSGSVKVGPNGVTQTATGANGETVSRSVSR
jgi:hypothetical protein